MRLTEAHLALLPTKIDEPNSTPYGGEGQRSDSYYSATTTDLINAVPPDGDMWLFVFGSLIWPQRFTCVEERPGLIRGCSAQMMLATSESEKVRFHTLNRQTQNRVVSHYVDSVTGKEVRQEDEVIEAAAREAVDHLTRPELDGFFIHGISTRPGVGAAGLIGRIHLLEDDTFEMQLAGGAEHGVAARFEMFGGADARI